MKGRLADNGAEKYHSWGEVENDGGKDCERVESFISVISIDRDTLLGVHCT